MFEELYNTSKTNGVKHEAIKFRAFSFFLSDRGINWLKSLDIGTIMNWPEMSNAFSTKFLPPSKTSALRIQITNFRQRGGESFSEAWDRYQELFCLCLHHGLDIQSH
jgi:Retrotransposon gag protein